MSLPREAETGDRQLVRYLLGLLPEEETDRLDELSIADETIAWRLRLLEDDLVDSYVRGSLEGESLERFESFYLASPLRREKVNFAGSFLHTIARPVGPKVANPGRGPAAPLPPGPVTLPADKRSARPALAPSSKAPTDARVRPRSYVNWKMLAVAALVVLAFGAVMLQQLRLRTGLATAQNQTAALVQRADQLEQQLSEQRRSLDAAAVKEPAAVSPPPPAPEVAAVRPPQPASGRLLPAALLLLPQTRAASAVATLAVPPGTDRVAFRLQLEANDFAAYQVELKDPANNHSVWRTGRLTATSAGDRPEVRVSIPATAMKPRHYSFELSGLNAAGQAEIIGSYIVQIVR